MSFIASMAAAAAVEAGLVTAGSIGAMAIGAAATGAAGAGLGAGLSALTGGDPANGALVGGIGGLLGGGFAGAGAMGVAGGAGAAGGAGVAGEVGATTAIAPEMGAGAGSGLGSGLGAGADVGTGTSSLSALSQNAISPQLANLGPGFAGTSLPGSVANYSSALDSAAPSMYTGSPLMTAAEAVNVPTVQSSVEGALPHSFMGLSNSGAAAAGKAATLAEPSFGAKIVAQMTGGDVNGALAKYGGGALQGMATGSGLGALTSGFTGGDIKQGMLTGALTGGIGGAATPALQGVGGGIGEFASAHPYITSGGIGLLGSAAINGLSGLSKGSNNGAPTYPTLKSSYYYDPTSYQPTTAPGIAYAQGGQTQGGGISDLGGYSDGGRLLKGPGDGVSDSIPAVIGDKQPARLAEGEFVVPARIVSELGNGSTDAGAKQLYAMMNRIQAGRHKTMGHRKFSENTHAADHLPA